MSSFNYQTEKARFDNLWSQLAKEYKEAGMAPDAIEEMKKYDWEEFKQRRNWRLHETLFSELRPSEESDDPDPTIPSPTLSKDLVTTDKYADIPKSKQYQWLREITSPDLLNQILLLSDSDLELFSAYMFEGYSQVEIARKLGIAQQTVAKKLKRIKKYLKNFAQGV